MLPKPPGCAGCPLETRGRGFVPPTGPVKAKILFVGEAAGSVEIMRHEGFVGPAGGMLNRLLYHLDLDRKSLRLKNIVACQPPGDFLVDAPWEEEAIAQCRQYLNPVLDEGHDVVVALGGVALRALLDYGKHDGVTVKDFHGTVNRDPSDRFWVVPTFHPSHLQRGAANLMGTVLFDLQVGQDVAINGFTRDKVSIVADPSLEWFIHWADIYLDMIAQDPNSVWLSVDIETDDKTGKTDEGELGPEDRSYRIIWINFAYSTDEGVTVPFAEPYLTIILRILASMGVKIFWNKKYDIRRLRAAGVILNGPLVDMMDGWHTLQSDTPRGLGYVSPFWSNLGPWKHLGNYDPIYRGMDGIQTLRNAYAQAEALQKMGMWDSFWELIHEVDEYAWTPAEDVGLLIDPEELTKFTEKLARLEDGFFADIQSLVPPELLRKYPKGGWIKEPSQEDVAALNETRAKKNEPLLKWDRFTKETVATLVQVCQGCLQTQVSKKHRCTDRSLTPDVQLQQAQVDRWYVVEEFNPGSWQQVLAYIIAKGHKPGRNRKRDNRPTTNRKTLDRLAKTRDPFYSKLIDYREVSKVKGTYADGTRRRMDKENRLHTTITSKPSTMRTSSVDPNLQNVVADKGGKEKIAAGFRRVVISSPGCKLVAIDYVGNEAAETGWFAGDSNLIRLSKLGLHGYITAGLPSINQPVDLNTWSEPDLIAHFKKLKKEFTQPYDDSKHGVYLTLYGGGPRTMMEQYPDSFRTLPYAQMIQNQIYTAFPKLKDFHHRVRKLAEKCNYLGGPGGEVIEGMTTIKHPYNFKHWFWDVISYYPLSHSEEAVRIKKHGFIVYFQGKPYGMREGNDWRRSVAYFPQSAGTGGKMRTDARCLFKPGMPDYVGDYYFGKTPLRAPIHDELFSEVPNGKVDSYIEKCVGVMSAPIKVQPCPEEWGVGPYLTIGVTVKVGTNWQDMEEVDIKGITPSPVASDFPIPPDNSEDDPDPELTKALA